MCCVETSTFIYRKKERKYFSTIKLHREANVFSRDQLGNWWVMIAPSNFPHC